MSLNLLDFPLIPEHIVLTGRVIGSLTKKGLEGATMQVLDQDTSVVISEVITDKDGKYTLALDPGAYIIRASHEDYIPEERNLPADWSTETLEDIILLTELGSGQYRIRLTWDVEPRDLDSHVFGYTSTGDSFHVYYVNMNAYEEEMNICNLDVDDVTSFGPEYITLTPTSTRPYYYYIHHYAGDGSITSTSKAHIAVFKGTSKDPIREFDAPAVGDGIYCATAVPGTAVTQVCFHPFEFHQQDSSSRPILDPKAYFFFGCWSRYSRSLR